MTTTEKTEELKAQQKKRPIDIARDTLITLSNEVKDLIEDGTFPTINTAIMETLYKDGSHHTFNTFMRWKKLGKSVKKGEKAFLLWSKPVRTGEAKQKEGIEEEENELLSPEEEVEYKYYGIAYLFSNAQVEDIPKVEPRAEEVEEPELPALMY